jgi:hypothetical protein
VACGIGGGEVDEAVALEVKEEGPDVSVDVLVRFWEDAFGLFFISTS